MKPLIFCFDIRDGIHHPIVVDQVSGMAHSTPPPLSPELKHSGLREK